jgi:chromosome segregation ATPase
MDDDYYTYRNADTEEQRQGIRNKFSDQKMFESAMVWSMYDHRKRAYPPIEEQLDMIYRNGLDHWKSEIQGIKSKYPDMTNDYTKKNQDNRIEDIKATLQTTKEELQTTKTELKADLSETKSVLEADLQTTKSELKADLQTTKEDLQTTKEDLQTTLTELADAKTDLEEKTYQIISLEARLAALEQKFISTN